MTAGGNGSDALFSYQPHPHEDARKDEGPVLAGHHLPSALKFNNWLAIKITSVVGTMWCAYAFGLLALVSLPAALSSGSVIVIVSWVAQTFLQLVLLSIIIVGQNILAQASDKRAQQTYEDAEAILHEAHQIQDHLLEQDRVILETSKTLLSVCETVKSQLTAGSGVTPS